jgi:hypothetical protein
VAIDGETLASDDGTLTQNVDHVFICDPFSGPYFDHLFANDCMFDFDLTYRIKLLRSHLIPVDQCQMLRCSPPCPNPSKKIYLP